MNMRTETNKALDIPDSELISIIKSLGELSPFAAYFAVKSLLGAFTYASATIEYFRGKVLDNYKTERVVNAMMTRKLFENWTEFNKLEEQFENYASLILSETDNFDYPNNLSEAIDLSIAALDKTERIKNGIDSKKLYREYDEDIRTLPKIT